MLDGSLPGHPRGARRRWILWIVRLSGLGVIPALFLTGLDLGSVVEAIRDAQPLWVALSVALLQASVVARVIRWRIFAEWLGVQYPSFGDYLALFYTGMFLGSVAPQTAASFAPVMFMAADGHSVKRSVSSIVLDRLAEAAAVTVFAIVAAIYLLPELPEIAIPFLCVAGAACLLAVLVAFAVRDSPGGRPAAVALVRRLIPDVEWPDLDAALLARSGALSVVVVALEAGVAVSAALAVDVGVGALFVGLTWSLVALVVSLPISLLGLGPREGLLVVVLGAGGESHDTAVAMGLVLFAMAVAVRLPGALAWMLWPGRKAPRASR